ncbi:hypothetical protein WPS_28030 [Vulcanimicrobium alpinum]|uniref:DUF202 domain-containing protein n=1 Tax=Vulcanimicrobium alpinum TaxID=3016050 RepID=A0AAN2CBA3_UNVUL|nr:DUF202 domain-containing protein [Vulcanimicrobium alpinum]BDE07527.1 hypothetical protein WPS_28030 [Vulcanimicrobium alpinum]
MRERTFLAYARTSLAFNGFGFVIARFSIFTRGFETISPTHHTSGAISSVFGTVMSLAGIACALYGAYRYVATARGLRAGEHRPMSDGAAIVIATIVGIIGTV